MNWRLMTEEEAERASQSQLLLEIERVRLHCNLLRAYSDKFVQVLLS